jgi:cell division protein FtsZ
MDDTIAEGTALKKFQIKVIGIGGAGGNAVAHLARASLSDVRYAVLNTDAAALSRMSVENRVVLGSKSMRGLGAGGDPERGRLAAEEDHETVRALCEGTDLVFLVAGLGGGTGTGAGPIVARIAKECGALVLGMVVLPFDCEGPRRQRQAQFGLHEFKKAADGVICLPNQKLLQFVDEKTSLPEAFAIGNEWVAQGVRGIWRMLFQPGLINVDFADLCGVLRDKHAEGSLATAEASGENRARDLIDQLLAHPLVENGHGLAETSGVLVSLAGGPDLTMTEVTRIMEQITRHCEQAHVIMGASIEESFRERLSVTLVSARRETIAPAEKLSAPRRTEESDFECASDTAVSSRPVSRFIAPPPGAGERPDSLIHSAARGRKNANRMRQGQLPLEIISKGRFEKSEPTLHQGQDLDVPTYIRRGVALN